MEYNVVLHEIFSKEFKSLLKKYPSLKQDVQTIIDNIENELALAIDLGDGFKKNQNKYQIERQRIERWWQNNIL